MANEPRVLVCVDGASASQLLAATLPLVATALISIELAGGVYLTAFSSRLHRTRSISTASI